MFIREYSWLSMFNSLHWMSKTHVDIHIYIYIHIYLHIIIYIHIIINCICASLMIIRFFCLGLDIYVQTSFQ